MRPIAVGGYKAVFFQVSWLGDTGNGVKTSAKEVDPLAPRRRIKDAEPVGRQSQCVRPTSCGDRVRGLPQLGYAGGQRLSTTSTLLQLASKTSHSLLGVGESPEVSLQAVKPVW